MKRILPFFLLLAIASCSSTGQDSSRSSASRGTPGSAATLSEADRSAVRTGVWANLGNESGSFRTMIGRHQAGGKVFVCGYIDTGSGDTPFVGTLERGSFTVSGMGGAREQTIEVQKSCQSRGILL